MSELSNSEASAAEEIRSLLSAADQMERQSIDNQLDVGHQLVAAKAACGHGSWLPFLARAGVQERRAQRLMKLARSGLKSVTVSDLGGIVRALEFLTKRDTALQKFDDALIQIAAGTDSAPTLEAAMQDIDRLYDMFPEEQRAQFERHNPQEDVPATVARLTHATQEALCAFSD